MLTNKPPKPSGLSPAGFLAGGFASVLDALAESNGLTPRERAVVGALGSLSVFDPVWKATDALRFDPEPDARGEAVRLLERYAGMLACLSAAAAEAVALAERTTVFVPADAPGCPENKAAPSEPNEPVEPDGPLGGAPRLSPASRSREAADRVARIARPGPCGGIRWPGSKSTHARNGRPSAG